MNTIDHASKSTETDESRKKYVRDVLAQEINYRRDRKSQIFSWASNLLVGITGGTIALTKHDQKPLSQNEGLILTLAILVLCVDANLWIHRNYSIEKYVVSKIERLNKDLEIPEVKEFPNALDSAATNPVALILLGLAAIGAIWLH